jgi:MerR family transcriptional regulator, heat shock protein HspR
MMDLEDRVRPLFMISVAAELAEMHPQTLRMYERRGLIRPKRSQKSTRLYSLEDVERLRRIQRLVNESGLNLAGVERVLELEGDLEQMRRRIEHLEAEMERVTSELIDRVEAVHRSYRRELVPVKDGGQVLVITESRRRTR